MLISTFQKKHTVLSTPHRTECIVPRATRLRAARTPEPEPAAYSEALQLSTWSSTVPITQTVTTISKEEAEPRPRRSPDVDWTRYHLQVLFIDRTDTTRARVAAGLFEQIAEWNGFGRALYPWTCGIDAKHNQQADLSTMASLMSQAALLGIQPKYFARAADRMELPDLDRYDIVIALDNSVRKDILARVDPQYYSYYDEKICLLTDFAPYTGSAVHQTGGLSLMPARMSNIIKQTAHQLQLQEDVTAPALAGSEGLEQWNMMVKVMLLACAGLVKFLIDAYPDDLPEYDPQ